MDRSQSVPKQKENHNDKPTWCGIFSCVGRTTSIDILHEASNEKIPQGARACSVLVDASHVLRDTETFLGCAFSSVMETIRRRSAEAVPHGAGFFIGSIPGSHPSASSYDPLLPIYYSGWLCLSIVQTASSETFPAVCSDALLPAQRLPTPNTQWHPCPKDRTSGDPTQTRICRN